MDCQTVRQFVEQHPEGGPGWRTAEGLAAQLHIGQCSRCHSATVDTREWDAHLRAVMQAAPVPDGLRERLLTQSASATLQTADVLVPYVASRRNLRRVASALTIAVAVLVAVGAWFNQAARMNLSAVGNSAGQTLRSVPASQLTPFDQSFVGDIEDPRWRGVCKSSAIGLDLDGKAGHDAVAYQVSIPSIRFNGWLLMVPISRIADIPESPYPALVSYSYHQAAWHDEKYVFVCISGQGSIQSLVEQWQGGTA